MLLSDIFTYLPTYITENFHKLCETCNVVEPFPQFYEPDYVKRGNTPSYTFCKLVDSEPYKSNLAKTNICNRLLSTLQDLSIDSSSLKSAILDKTPYFTLVLLQSKEFRDIEKQLKSHIGEGNLVALLYSTLSELKLTLSDIWGDVKTRPKFLWDVCEFYLTLVQQIALEEQKTLFYPIAYPLPCYIPKTVENRILLLGLLPRKLELKGNLDKITPNFHNCCSKFLSPSLENFSISPALFKQLIASLPRKKIEPKFRLMTVTPFENYIWKGHLYVLPKFKSKEQDYLNKQPNLFKQYEDWELLAQIICLMQPNWERLWYMCGWSSSLGIVRRLNFLKKEEKWSPPNHVMVELLAKP